MTTKVKQVRHPTPAHLVGYRQQLVEAEQKSQEDFDKTVLSLSGGALGISFVFLKDVIGASPIFSPNLLFLAWISWGLSTFCVLLSFFFSHLALRRAIDQVDSGAIETQKPGGFYSGITATLNALGAILFFVGVCMITWFAEVNLSQKENPNGNTKSPVTSPVTSPASSPRNVAVP